MIMRDHGINFNTRLTPETHAMEKVIIKLDNKLNMEKKAREHVENLFKNIKKAVKKGHIETSSLLLDQWLRADRRHAFVADARGHRWSTNEKLNSLTLYRRGPKLYRKLLIMMPNCLPSVRTLRRLSQAIDLHPGINHIILEAIGLKSKDMSSKNLYSILKYDEISIRPRYYYNVNSDKVIGHQDYGDLLETENNNRPAKKALVFMLQGLHVPWKLPVAYFFNDGKMTSDHMEKLILKVIETVQKVGIKVFGTCSDQGGPNKKATENMRVKSDDGKKCTYFHFNNGNIQQKIYILYDVPHMLKCFRNNWLGAWESWCKDETFDQYYKEYPGNILSLDGKEGKWEYLVILFSLRHNSGDSEMNRTMMFPRSRDKMRVYLALQLLSATTVRYLRDPTFHDELRKLPNFTEKMIEEALATADVVEFLDRLGDYTNGPSSEELKNPKKASKILVSETSPHMQEWEKAIRILENTYFCTQSAKKLNVPSVEAYVWTLKALKEMWPDLRDNHGFKTLNLRYLNQDCLENFFGRIRSGCGDNDHPTVANFIGTYSSLFMTDFSLDPIEGANCEMDDIPILVRQTDLIQIYERERQNNKTKNDLASVNLTTPTAATTTTPTTTTATSNDITTDAENEAICVEEKEAEEGEQEDNMGSFGVLFHISDYESDDNDVLDVMIKSPHLSIQVIATTMLKRLDFLECANCKTCFTTAIGNDCIFYEAANEFKHAIARAINTFNQCVDDEWHKKNISVILKNEFYKHLNMKWLKCSEPEHTKKLQDQVFKQLAIILLKRHCTLQNNRQVDLESRAKNAKKIVEQKDYEGNHQTASARAPKKRKSQQKAESISRKRKTNYQNENKDQLDQGQLCQELNGNMVAASSSNNVGILQTFSHQQLADTPVKIPSNSSNNRRLDFHRIFQQGQSEETVTAAAAGSGSVSSILQPHPQQQFTNKPVKLPPSITNVTLLNPQRKKHQKSLVTVVTPGGSSSSLLQSISQQQSTDKLVKITSNSSNNRRLDFHGVFQKVSSEKTVAAAAAGSGSVSSILQPHSQQQFTNEPVKLTPSITNIPPSNPEEKTPQKQVGKIVVAAATAGSGRVSSFLQPHSQQQFTNKPVKFTTTNVTPLNPEENTPPKEVEKIVAGVAAAGSGSATNATTLTYEEELHQQPPRNIAAAGGSVSRPISRQQLTDTPVRTTSKISNIKRLNFTEVVHRKPIGKTIAVSVGRGRAAGILQPISQQQFTKKPVKLTPSITNVTPSNPEEKTPQRQVGKIVAAVAASSGSAGSILQPISQQQFTSKPVKLTPSITNILPSNLEEKTPQKQVGQMVAAAAASSGSASSFLQPLPQRQFTNQPVQSTPSIINATTLNYEEELDHQPPRKVAAVGRSVLQPMSRQQLTDTPVRTTSKISNIKRLNFTEVVHRKPIGKTIAVSVGRGRAAGILQPISQQQFTNKAVQSTPSITNVTTLNYEEELDHQPPRKVAAVGRSVLQPMSRQQLIDTPLRITPKTDYIKALNFQGVNHEGLFKKTFSAATGSAGTNGMFQPIFEQRVTKKPANSEQSIKNPTLLQNVKENYIQKPI